MRNNSTSLIWPTAIIGFMFFIMWLWKNWSKQNDINLNEFTIVENDNPKNNKFPLGVSINGITNSILNLKRHVPYKFIYKNTRDNNDNNSFIYFTRDETVGSKYKIKNSAEIINGQMSNVIFDKRYPDIFYYQLTKSCGKINLI